VLESTISMLKDNPFTFFKEIVTRKWPSTLTMITPTSVIIAKTTFMHRLRDRVGYVSKRMYEIEVATTAIEKGVSYHQAKKFLSKFEPPNMPWTMEETLLKELADVVSLQTYRGNLVDKRALVLKVDELCQQLKEHASRWMQTSNHSKASVSESTTETNDVIEDNTEPETAFCSESEIEEDEITAEDSILTSASELSSEIDIETDTDTDEDCED
jgi:hypothetical protein